MGDTFFSLNGPLDALPTETQMRAANFGGFTDLVRARGRDPRPILERHGLDAGAIRDPDLFINCQSLVDVFEYCSTTFDDPMFGIHLGQMQEPDVFGCVTTLVRAAPTFRKSVQSLIDYMPMVHSPSFELELLEDRAIAELRWRVSADLGCNDQANFQGTVLNLKLLRQIGGRSFKPSYVTLTTRNNDTEAVGAEFGCEFRQGSVNAVAFPVHVLDQPTPTANRLLFRLVSGYLDSVKGAQRTSIVERVEDYIRGAMPLGTCSIERCAEKLGLSVRTLQAKLSERGLRFSDILEVQRVEIAKTYLLHEEMSLDEVAARLGYSEQSSFGRAFRRWTGSTPQRFRAAHGVKLN